jgi:hypothetical protein
MESGNLHSRSDLNWRMITLGLERMPPIEGLGRSSFISTKHLPRRCMILDTTWILSPKMRQELTSRQLGWERCSVGSFRVFWGLAASIPRAHGSQYTAVENRAGPQWAPALDHEEQLSFLPSNRKDLPFASNPITGSMKPLTVCSAADLGRILILLEHTAVECRQWQSWN